MSKPVLEWKRGPYSIRTSAGRVEMLVSWGLHRTEKYVGRCGSLGLETKGHDTEEAAQVAIEGMVREALKEAQAAFF